MPETENKKIIEIRSDEIQEILGIIPNWIIRWGITVIFIIIIIIIIGTWFFKYPDIINSSITLTTVNPPAFIKARIDGKLEKLFILDKQKVSKDENLAVIENTASHTHVFKLKTRIAEIKDKLRKKNISLIKINEDLDLGMLQNSFTSFLANFKELEHFTNLNYHRQKINSIEDQIKLHYQLYERYSKQKVLLQNELELNNQKYSRDSLLYMRGLISREELESSEIEYLQKQYSFEGTQSNMTNMKIEIDRLNQQKLELELKFTEEQNQLFIKLNESINLLESAISQWEYLYLIKAPIEGIVTFTKYWSENQNVNVNDKVLTIVPTEESNLIGKLSLPLRGAGKVKLGQTVFIKLLNYPHVEYGMLKGAVKNVSLISEGDFYSVEISLPKGLLTTYGKELEFTQEMQGLAEIVTDDVRLLERIFKPIKSILTKNTI